MHAPVDLKLSVDLVPMPNEFGPMASTYKPKRTLVG